MPSEIITEDDVIRKRILLDGEGAGDEKRVTTLLKTFVKWLHDPQADDYTFHKMLALISQCEMAVDKLQVVKQMNEQESKNYQKLHSDIEKEIEEGKKRIESYKRQLDEAKVIKTNKQHYDVIGKIIRQYPSRNETTESITNLEAEISELRKRKMKLDEDVSQKKRQFEVLVYSIQQLQHDLHTQQATAQADKETEEMDTS